MMQHIRIVQLIDSLDAGGAERMAVNYANALSASIEFSGLLVSRKEGPLKEQVSEKVSYLFLSKSRTFDFQTVKKIRHYCKVNRVAIIHAHGTSFFTALLVKFTLWRLQIIWHDHHGNRAQNKGLINWAVVLLSFFFSGVIVVNRELEQWAKQHLYINKIQYFPNFITSEVSAKFAITKLKGNEGKRIVFLANLRNPKNHLGLLEAFISSNALKEQWTLHLIGKEFNDNYSKRVRDFIEENVLQDVVYLYGACNDIEPLLAQAQIGILSSHYEGFPVTLLEYGKAGLCVVSTNVGYCKEVIEEGVSGLLFDPFKKEELVQKINQVIEDEVLRMKFSTHLYQKVLAEYSDEAVIRHYLEWIQS
jgi:glycosyltransferase involved in cell wall biosynthesis